MNNGIRTMADELREQLRQGENAPAVTPAQDDPAATVKTRKPAAGAPDTAKKAAGPKIPEPLAELFEKLRAYELTGTEKLLIRLDGKTVFLLKQLKIVKGVDMNKLIAYSVQHFLEANPELIPFIKRSLNHLEL
jgi:hypothetical protein